MFKYSLKVIFTTILIALVCVCFAFMIVASFAPKKMSEFYSDIGVNGRAYVYANKAYEKDGSIENAVDLTNIAIKCHDNEKISYSIELLLNHSDFDSYIKNSPSGTAYYDFITWEYVTALYYLGKTDASSLCEKAYNFTKPDYRYSNALQALISVGAENRNIELLNRVLATLKEYADSGICVKTSLNRLNNDIFKLEELIERLSK